MSDVTAVKEALDFYENKRPRALNNWEMLDRLADAARSYVRWVEEGPDYEAAHRMNSGNISRNGTRAIVDAALVVPLSTTEETE